MTSALQIDDLRHDELQGCWEIWRTALHRELESCAWIPRFWLDDPGPCRESLARRVREGRVVAARLHGELVGYMAYDTFPFHGEQCAFSPITAHGATASLAAAVYLAMYRHLSHRWVGDGCRTHLITIWAHDGELRELVYGLGFGLYVVDAYRSTEQLEGEEPPGIDIRQALTPDVHELSRLVEESRVYYAQSPLFLVRQPYGLGSVRKLLEDDTSATFIASSFGVPVAFMNVRLAAGDDTQTLCGRSTALIDPLGAFVRRGWRGEGVGTALLARCLQWCRSRGAAQLHVDFESANSLGSRFWRRHFTPALASVKRTVFADACDQRHRIAVVDHDPAWSRQYEAEEKALREALGPLVKEMHHIGSTAVPGLPAKPTLDILVEVSDVVAVDHLCASIERLGYRAMGEHGIKGRRYFQKGNPQHTHHLHIYRRGDPNIARHLAFRDYLRCHPHRAREYGELKLGLARRDPYDVDGYLAGKRGMVKRLEDEGLKWRGL